MAKAIQPYPMDLGTMPAAVLAEQQRRFQMSQSDDIQDEDDDTLQVVASIPAPHVAPTTGTYVPSSALGIAIPAYQLVDEVVEITSASDRSSSDKSDMGSLQLPYVMFSQNPNGFTFITNLAWQPKLLANYRFELRAKGLALLGVYAGSFFPLPGSKLNILSFILTEEPNHDQERAN